MAYYIQIQYENRIIKEKLFINPESSIENLKFQIKKLFNYEDQILFYHEIELNDKKTLNDYQIKKNEIILLKVNNKKNDISNIIIKIKNQYFNENNEEVKEFNLLPNKTIFDLKTEIEKVLKIEIHNQKIVNENNNELENEEKIDNFSSKILFLKHFNEKNIIIINKNGKSNFLLSDFNENNVILHIKNKIFEIYKTQIENQKLFYENEEKNNDFSLMNIPKKYILLEYEELVEITILNYSKIFKIEKGSNIIKLKFIIEENLKILFHSIKIYDENFQNELINDEIIENNLNINVKIMCDFVIINLINNNEFLIQVENEKNIEFLKNKIREEQNINEDFKIFFNDKELKNNQIIDNIIDNNYLKAYYFQIIK